MATLDTPPTYPAFGMMDALKPKIHDQITPNSQIASYNQITSYSSTVPILPNMSSSMLSNQLPTLLPGFNPYIYPYSLFYYQMPQFQTTSSNISLKEFFSKLDQIHNSNGLYASFENSFEKYGVTVNGIKDLTDEQLDELGIIQFG
ncbi:9652_t:CDS:1 [Dentiscutata erythropus]|uniref:9652_t:CDS:1 n=1 Tax=Dentiscutata erythropus TaxID=1348616 RepID=A0A9N9I1C1_9GLOM|nr:9652_t:CDS:1 [Dentiscutata erythropus]